MEKCPKCNKSDKVEKFHTVEPMSEDDVKSFVCLRCMYVVGTEGADLEAIIYQVEELIGEVK